MFAWTARRGELLRFWHVTIPGRRDAFGTQVKWCKFINPATMPEVGSDNGERAGRPEQGKLVFL